VWTSLITFTLLYAALAVIELRLLVRYAKAGPQPEPVTSTDDVDGERPLAFAY
jgi:cytochrome d ubiquinol oxidase subunit I